MLDLLNPIDREEFKKGFLTREPFPYFCIDNYLREDFANEVLDGFPAYEDAQKLGKEFTAVNEKRKVQITDSSKFSPAIKKLNDLLASKEHLEMWSDLTGIDDLFSDANLVGGGIHETNSGGHLDVHVDFNFNKENQSYRRLNMLIYFNKDWKEEYGGYLDIWDEDVQKCFGSFSPKFNRVCGFITSEKSWHGVTPITCPPEIFRKSFATYYYTSEMPEDMADKHSTIFRPRPKEFMKGHIAMPIEKSLRSGRNMYRGAKQIVKNLIGK